MKTKIHPMFLLKICGRNVMCHYNEIMIQFTHYYLIEIPLFNFIEN